MQKLLFVTMLPLIVRAIGKLTQKGRPLCQETFPFGLPKSNGTFLEKIFLIILLSLIPGVSFASVPLAERDWQIEALESEQVILFYPSIMSEENAKSFLEDREKALQFVEDLLKVRYEGRITVIITVSLIRTSGYAGSYYIHYYFPFPYLRGAVPLQDREKGEVAVHEMVHVVALQRWGPLASPALVEGLAVAIDSISRPSMIVNPHLVSKGLLQMGRLKPLGELLSLELFPYDVKDMIYIYQEGGSFVLYLIQSYGVERFKELYPISYLPLSALKEEIRQIYRKELSSLEEEWHKFLRNYMPELEKRAKYIVEAHLNLLGSEINSLAHQLEFFWQTAPYKLIGPCSEKIYMKITASQAVLRNLEINTSTDEEEEYRVFLESLETLGDSLVIWAEAIHAFLDAQKLVPLGSNLNYIDIITKLEEAQKLYQEVEDKVMITRTGDYITAFQLLQEGEELLWVDNARAKPLLLRALALFLKLDDQQMANRVRSLLNLCRYVVI